MGGKKKNVWTFILLSAQINGSTTREFAASLCFLCQFDALFLLHMLMWFWKWAWQCRINVFVC